MEKIKVYELDFGDTNLLTPSIDEVLAWIKTDLQSLKKEGGFLSYTVTTKLMIQEEIDKIPDWA